MPQKWEGRFTSGDKVTSFSLSDVKGDKGYFYANGIEQGTAFTISGPIVGDRARLLKQYKGQSRYITLHMRVGRGFMQGVWVMGGATGSVSFGSV